MVVINKLYFVGVCKFVICNFGLWVLYGVVLEVIFCCVIGWFFLNRDLLIDVLLI